MHDRWHHNVDTVAVRTVKAEFSGLETELDQRACSLGPENRVAVVAGGGLSMKGGHKASDRGIGVVMRTGLTRCCGGGGFKQVKDPFAETL